MVQLNLPVRLSACLALLTLYLTMPLGAEAQMYPNCPITGQPPKMTTIAHTRCLSATNMSCCGDCADIVYALAGVSANISDIICSLTPNACPLVQGSSGDMQICSAFADTPDCESHIEQMVCAVSCFPDSGTWLQPSGTNGTYNFTVCSGYAERVYASCTNLRLPGLSGPIAQSIPSAQIFLAAVFQGFANVEGLGQYKFNIQTSGIMRGCYNGPGQFPAQRPCCDPLYTSTCPAGSVDFNAHPNWRPFSGRAVNQTVCMVGQPSQPASAGSPPMAPPPSPGSSPMAPSPPPDSPVSSPPPPTSSSAARSIHGSLLAVGALVIVALSV